MLYRLDLYGGQVPNGLPVYVIHALNENSMLYPISNI